MDMLDRAARGAVLTTGLAGFAGADAGTTRAGVEAPPSRAIARTATITEGGRFPPHATAFVHAGLPAPQLAPRAVLADCVEIAAGAFHSAAISRTGDLYVWGDNACNQVGDDVGAAVGCEVGAALGRVVGAAVHSSARAITWRKSRRRCAPAIAAPAPRRRQQHPRVKLKALA